MAHKNQFVNLAIKPETRDKLRMLAKLRRTNLHLLIDMIADTELKKNLPR